MNNIRPFLTLAGALSCLVQGQSHISKPVAAPASLSGKLIASVQKFCDSLGWKFNANTARCERQPPATRWEVSGSNETFFVDGTTLVVEHAANWQFYRNRRFSAIRDVPYLVTDAAWLKYGVGVSKRIWPDLVLKDGRCQSRDPNAMDMQSSGARTENLSFGIASPARKSHGTVVLILDREDGKVLKVQYIKFDPSR